MGTSLMFIDGPVVFENQVDLVHCKDSNLPNYEPKYSYLVSNSSVALYCIEDRF